MANGLNRFFFRAEYNELESPEQSSWAIMLRVVKENWVQMVGMNLLFVLCCLPVITIPAATAALHRVMLDRVRGRWERPLTAFFAEFRTSFFTRAFVGLLLLLAPVSLASYAWMLQKPSVAVGIFAAASLIVFCITSYFYPLLVLLDVPVLKNLKNACCMAALEWRTTLLMLLTAGVLDVLLAVLTAYALPLFVFFLCTFQVLLCCCFFHAPFHKYFENDPEP